MTDVTKMKLLMLHGYTQNSDVFRRKLRRLTDRIDQAFPGVTYKWLDGPIHLQTSDMPDRQDRTLAADCSDDLDLRAWFSLRYARDPPEGLLRSLDLVAEVLQRQGPFHGVIAFSQGTVIASTVAALLQGKTRLQAFETAYKNSEECVSYPRSFLSVQHPPFKFGILYAGCVGRGRFYDWWYSPAIATPFCHFVGLLDPTVEHEEREAVFRRLLGHPRSKVVLHAGAHHVPTNKASVEAALGFISNTVGSIRTKACQNSKPIADRIVASAEV